MNREKLDTEMFSLDYTLANLILPKLLYFKNWTVHYGCPANLEMDEWFEVLDEMIFAFTYVCQDYYTNSFQYMADIEFVDVPSELHITKLLEVKYIDEERFRIEDAKYRARVARCQNGLRLFAQHYMSLWT